jgi:hypothetical protein
MAQRILAGRIDFLARGRLSRLAIVGVFLVGALLTVTPRGVAAVEPIGGLTTDWTAQETEHFRFFVQTNDRMTAEAFVETYGTYAETAYDEISLLFKATADRKIAVYVYGDTAAFDAAMAVVPRNEIDGIDAVADPRQFDVSIALPRFAGRSDLEAENQIRHATSHILAGIASGFNLPRGFDEGIAQYVERPNTPKLARIAAVVQSANLSGDLISWSELNRDVPPQGSDEMIAAQAYSVVAYLIQHQGLPEFQRFLAELKITPGWRDAMKIAYAPGTSDTLSKQWYEKIPMWASGDWRWNLFAGFDLSTARELLARGNYKAAQDTLQLSEQLFMSLDDQVRRDEVEVLKTQCAIGIQAEELMANTQQALERHTYDRAASYLAKAKAQYDQLPPEQRPDELLVTYEHLATVGAEAMIQLDSATGLAQSWGDYREARSSASEAGRTFASLGDEERRTQAESLLAELDTRQRRLVLMLGALAVLTLAWLILWLWARGRQDLQWE